MPALRRMDKMSIGAGPAALAPAAAAAVAGGEL